MTVYLDIVLIENILLNFIILFGVGQIIKTKMSNIRLIIASTFGAVYAVISLLNIIPLYSTLPMKILLSIIIVYIAFNPDSVKNLIKSLALFYLISFATGGCAFALLYIVSPNSVVFENGVFVGIYPLKITLIAGAVGFIIIQYSFAINKRNLKRSDLICNLRIKIQNEIIETKAFMDSGNNLKEPITGKPVIIVEKGLISNKINLESIERFEGGDEKLHIYIIPFKAIGKSNGMLIGIQSEYVEIEFKDERFLIEHAILGMYDKKIGKHYSALIGLEMMNDNTYNEKGLVTK